MLIGLTNWLKKKKKKKKKNRDLSMNSLKGTLPREVGLWNNIKTLFVYIYMILYENYITPFFLHITHIVFYIITIIIIIILLQ